MSLGATTSAPASTCETAVRASSSSEASLSTSPSRDHAAVAVRGVLAQADVGEQQRAPGTAGAARAAPAARSRRRSTRRSPRRPSPPGSRTGSPLRRRARTSSSASRTSRSTVWRAGPAAARSPVPRARRRAASTRSSTRDRRLPHEIAQAARSAAAAADASRGKRSRPEWYAQPRGPPPRASPRPASHPASRATAPQGGSRKRRGEEANACAKGRASLTQPAAAKTSAGISPRKTTGSTTQDRDERGRAGLPRQRRRQARRGRRARAGQREADAASSGSRLQGSPPAT